MMYRWFKRLALLSYLLLLLLFMRYSTIIVYEIRTVIYLFIDQLLPIFIPFLILLHLILMNPEKTWFIRWLYPSFKKTLHLNQFGTLTTCLSLISSFPLGAVMVKQGYLEGRLNKAQAHHLLMFTNQASPIFISTIVVTYLFPIRRMGMALIVIQWLTNLSIAYMTHFYYQSKASSTVMAPLLVDKPLPTANNNDVIIKTGTTLLTILSMMVMARFLNVLLTSLYLFDFSSIYLSKLWPWSVDLSNINLILQATIELTQGIDLLRLTSFNSTTLFLVTNALINFHGLSIHMQVYGLIKSTDLSFTPYLLSRMAAIGISLTYSYLYVYLYQPFRNTDIIPIFYEMQKEPSPLFTIAGLSSFYFGLCLIVTLRSSYISTYDK